MGHVDDLVSTDIKQQKVMLIKILQIVKYLACQGLPFRGHDDSNGNIIQLMLLRGVDYPMVEAWMKKKRDTYFYLMIYRMN